MLLVTFLLSIGIQPVSRAAGVELVPSSRVILKITEDMTIDDIIARIYPNNKNLWPLIKTKLIETNPYSFVQYSDRLIPGVALKLLDIKRVPDQPELLPKILVGHVVRAGGEVSAIDVNGRMHQLKVNSEIYEGDRIVTEPGASLYILMDDGAEVDLKEDSELKISEYVITSGYDKGSSSILDLIRGGLRKLTGSIRASSTANYKLQTGLATIGIRGTEYVVKLCKLDDCTKNVNRNDPDAKLHAVVLEGAISLTTGSDVQLLVAAGQYGTATPAGEAVEEDGPVPTGFLDEEETQLYNVTAPQQADQQEEETGIPWIGILGVLLLVVGL